MAKAKKKEKKKETKYVVRNGVPMPAERAKFSDWVNKLPYQDFKTVAEFVSKEVEMEVDRRSKNVFEKITDLVDRTLSASLVINTDLTYAEIEDIITQASVMMCEDEKKYSVKEEGDERVVARINKKVERIKARVVELIEEGKKQKEIIEIVHKENEDLTKSMIANGYKRIQEEYEIVKEEECREENNKKIQELIKEGTGVDRDIEKGLEYIFGAEEEAVKEVEVVKEVKAPKKKGRKKKVEVLVESPEEVRAQEEAERLAKETAKEVAKEVVKEVAKEVKVNKESEVKNVDHEIKVISKEIVLEGKFAKYNVNEYGVVIEDKEVEAEAVTDLTYYTVKEIEQAANDRIKEIEKRRDEAIFIYNNYMIK